jgi:hypothetical protein
MKIYILSSGLIGDAALPEAAFKTKKDMNAYIKKEYPDAKLYGKSFLYWEYDTMCLVAQKLPML